MPAKGCYRVVVSNACCKIFVLSREMEGNGFHLSLPSPNSDSSTLAKNCRVRMSESSRPICCSGRAPIGSGKAPVCKGGVSFRCGGVSRSRFDGTRLGCVRKCVSTFRGDLTTASCGGPRAKCEGCVSIASFVSCVLSARFYRGMSNCHLDAGLCGCESDGSSGFGASL